MTDMKTYEYIWLDGYTPEPFMRSKVKATDSSTPPDWSFDGSSTQQAEGGSSDCLLLPVQTYSNPNGHDLVMTQVQSADHTTHPSNFRAAAAEVVTDEWWFGFEQEFFFTDPKTGEPLGWEDGTPREQGEYYCGVGANNIFGREIVEEHMQLCIDAGLDISGINAEVMPGQWEFQIGPTGSPEVGDQLWIARWLLYRIAEDYGVTVSIEPKPAKGDWNGAGAHTNFSTKSCLLYTSPSPRD